MERLENDLRGGPTYNVGGYRRDFTAEGLRRGSSLLPPPVAPHHRASGIFERSPKNTRGFRKSRRARRDDKGERIRATVKLD